MGGGLVVRAAEPAEPDDEGVARLARMLKRRPADPALHYNLGTTLYHQAAYDRAAESLNKALASSGASLQPRASYNLGNTRYRQGQAKQATSPGEALELYRQALDDYRLAIRRRCLSP